MSLRRIWSLVWHLSPEAAIRRKYMAVKEKEGAKKRVAKGNEVKDFFAQRGALREG